MNGQPDDRVIAVAASELEERRLAARREFRCDQQFRGPKVGVEQSLEEFGRLDPSPAL